MPGYANSADGFGRGFGRGMGRGNGRGFGYGSGIGLGGGMGWGAAPSPVVPVAAAPSADVEKWNLERRSEALEEELRLIRGRLGALESTSGQSSESK